jgi:hypothetical protein
VPKLSPDSAARKPIAQPSNDNTARVRALALRLGYRVARARRPGVPLTPWQHFSLGAKYLAKAKLSLPVPLVAALNGKPCPLARGSADALAGWMLHNGYVTPGQRGALTRTLSALTLSEQYLRSIATGVPRMTLDGAFDGCVTKAEAAFAAYALGEEVQAELQSTEKLAE